MTDLKKVIVSAYSPQDRIIENNGKILAFFRDKSRGYRLSRRNHPVIMEDSTFRSLLHDQSQLPYVDRRGKVVPRIIPGRTNIVVSTTLNNWDKPQRVLKKNRNPNWYASKYNIAPWGVVVCPTIEEALEYAGTIDERVFIAGERSTIEATMPLVDRLEITEIHHRVKGKTQFPEINLTEWQEVFREKHYPFSFVTYVKRTIEDKQD